MKQCEECKHFNNTICKLFSSTRTIHGVRITTDLSAKLARSKYGACEEEGKLWEKREIIEIKPANFY